MQQEKTKIQVQGVPDTMTVVGEITRLKKERNAIILAHNYQIGPVQDIADVVGDSLELSRAAATMAGDVIVFAGVDFMAETAAILSPQKTVLLPAAGACCPMAEMITADELRLARSRHPGAAVVCYVNSSAEIKAESDICCTSSNAVRVVQSLREDQVIFVPDKNLARYAARFTKKEILPWEGFCIVHDHITVDHVRKAHVLHPNATVLVHPECRPAVIDAADHVASTSGMIRHVCTSQDREFIIGTETGILHRLKRDCPEKICYPLSGSMVCTNMKKTDLQMIRNALETLRPRITVPEDIAGKARHAIERMLAV